MDLRKSEEMPVMKTANIPSGEEFKGAMKRGQWPPPPLAAAGGLRIITAKTASDAKSSVSR